MLPPVTSSEEEEGLELDYANDPPTPHVKGTAQGWGSSTFRNQVKAEGLLRLGWDVEWILDSAELPTIQDNMVWGRESGERSGDEVLVVQ